MPAWLSWLNFRFVRDTTRIRTAPQLVGAISCLQQLSFFSRMMGNWMSHAFSGTALFVHVLFSSLLPAQTDAAKEVTVAAWLGSRTCFKRARKPRPASHNRRLLKSMNGIVCQPSRP